MAIREPLDPQQPDNGSTKHALKPQAAEADNRGSLPTLQDLVGESPAFQKVLRQVGFVAPTESTILIQGEKGTGKEMIAGAVHYLSRRRNRPFISLECATLSHESLKSAIFGPERQVFTGRRDRLPRKPERAPLGTLCLNEIGDLPLELQASLLRLLQERESACPDDAGPLPAGARMIATTSRNLAQMVEQQQFRIDLYYHIDVFPIVLPPLRERREDILRLAEHFLASYSKRMNKQIETIPSEVTGRMMEYKWPGNVRELQSFVERAVILTTGRVLQAPLAELRVPAIMTQWAPVACDKAGSGSPRMVRFDPFEADLRAGELRKRGIRIRLQEQPFRVLAMLLVRAGEVVTREELQKHLWPADTFVDFDHGLNKAISKVRDALGDSADKARFVETVGRRGYRFMMPVRKVGEGGLSSGRRPVSLAVLPFRNEGDPENEFLSDGITESIINKFSGLPAARVIARSTVFRYKHKNIDPRLIGRELDVQAVIVGRFLEKGDAVSISAELVDVDNGWQLWGGNYSRSLSKILLVKEEICREIAARLDLCPASEDQEHLAKRHTESSEAYRDYLRGRFYCNKMTEPEVKKGIAFFRQAIQLDPRYALAYAGISDAYCLCVFLGLLPPCEAMAQAKEAAIHAVSIDESLAEAHASLACIKEAYDWDWPGAEAEFLRALELNPQQSTARRWYADYLTATGRTEEALREIQRALDLDPLSVVINNEVAWNFYMARQYDRAIEQSLRCLDIEPAFAPAHHVLGMVYLQTARHKQAIAEIERARELSAGNLSTLASLGYAYATAGRRDEAMSFLGQLNELAKRHYVSPYWRAIVHAGLHETDQALGCLEGCCAERGVWLIFLKMDPRFDNLRAHPRFHDLLSRVGFFPETSHLHSRQCPVPQGGIAPVRCADPANLWTLGPRRRYRFP